MLLSCCILILLLLILLILSLPLVRLLVLSLSLIWSGCSFFCICYFSCLYTFIYTSLTLICHIFPFVNFPAISLLFSKFNSSQMLEFDDSWKLITTRILSGIIPDEKPFISFLSFFCFRITPGNSNTSILIPLTSLSFPNNWGSLLIFEIPDEPHVMYSSAMCS